MEGTFLEYVKRNQDEWKNQEAKTQNALSDEKGKYRNQMQEMRKTIGLCEEYHLQSAHADIKAEALDRLKQLSNASDASVDQLDKVVFLH